MKKLGLIPLILFLAAGWANAAQWTKIGSGTGSTFYIDKGSAILQGTGHKVWSMNSFASEQTAPDGTKYLSVKALHLYSCEERTATLLGQVFYAEAMGKGALLQNYKYERFAAEDIVPDSLQESVLKSVCAKQK